MAALVKIMGNWEVEIADSIEERIRRDGYGSLTRPERLFHGVSWLLFVAYGPGFVQYFSETHQEWVDAALEGLAEIGANGMASHLRTAIACLPYQRIPADREARDTLLNSLTPEKQENIGAVCSRFTEEPYPDQELIVFAQANDSAFLGPRTELELWQSKTDRGVVTTPTYRTKDIDFDLEAEKDRPNSSRSCPNCGYPSPDYRPRCKRCDYPHGRA